MTFSRVEWELLASANEDVYGLWEVLATVRSAPLNVPESQALAVAKDALQSLLDRGLIYICWFRHEDSQEERIPAREAAGFLAGPSCWDAPLSGDRYLAFTATPAGLRAWQRAAVPVAKPAK
jgi:hypothetical protein